MSNTAGSGVLGSSNIEAQYPERKSWGMGSGVKKEGKRKFWGR
jgi:hypothetical protein